MAAEAPLAPRPAPSREAGPRFSPSMILIYGLLILAAIAFVLPFYWMVVSALRPTADFYKIPIPLVPDPPSLENFQALFERSMFGRGIAEHRLPGGRLGHPAGLVLRPGRLHLRQAALRRSRAPLRGVLATMMIPLGVGMIPNFIIMARIHWVDTFLPLIVPGIANAFGVFWMRQYCLSLPDDLLDAARVDGTGEFGIFWRIVLPIIRPALASLAIFVFLSTWNDFLQPLVFLRSQENFTVQLWLSFVSRVNNVGQPAIVMAGSVLASIPIVIMFATAAAALHCRSYRGQ